MKIVVYLSLIFFASFQCYANQPVQQDIKTIINTFDQALQKKDKATFLSLFVDPNKTMIAVVSDQGLEKRKALIEEYNKTHEKQLEVTRTFSVTPTQMIDRNLSRKEHSHETFENISIVSDGYIANVYFDYAFYINDKKTNWGKETWQMILTMQGWKINSVIYSITSS